MSKKSPMLRLNKDQLQKKVDFVHDYIKAPNAATGAVLDSNANVSQKNISTLHSEIHKDINIQINRALTTEKIKELFGEDLSIEYLRQLEAHEIYCHDETNCYPYCVSISMYPFLVNGMRDLGGESTAPKHLNSYCGSFINLAFAISSQFAGAVATVEFLMHFDYFARKDYGPNYLEEHEDKISSSLQHVVYSLNQPAAARGFQTIFWNISLFDEPYFNSIFEGFVYPGTDDRPVYSSIAKLQAYFLSWFNKERERSLLTFPVVTAASLCKDGQPVDKTFAHLLSDELSKGNSFFIYQSDSADSLASCCFEGSQPILVKDSFGGVSLVPIKDYFERSWTEKKNVTVFHDGSWVKAHPIKVPRGDKKIFKVTTSNKKEIIVTEDHINPTLRGDVVTSSLTTDDYLLFNQSVLSTSLVYEDSLSYDEGFMVGAYLGDGSIYDAKECDSTTLTFSLNYEKAEIFMQKFPDFLRHDGENNCVSVSTNNKEKSGFIRTWVTGGYANTKRLNLNCLKQSEAFRRGILDGYYLTDGGNSNRIYTTSKGLVDDVEALLTSLGLCSVIDVSDRTDEPVVIRGEIFSRNYPLYCIRYYTPGNKRSMGDVFVKRNGQTFFKISSIEEVSTCDPFVYCFVVNEKYEPYFTLPNGVITHNCRVRNEFQDKPQFSYTLGAGGVATGSVNVMTLNMNRLVQDGRDLLTEVEKLHKYQVAYREVVKTFLEAKMLPAYDAGFIYLDKQYSTIGVIGLVEAAEFMQLVPGNNEEYKSWIRNTLKVIYDANKKAKQQYNIPFNTEMVPGESLGVKFAHWDKKDGYIVPRDCYNSYFYPVEDYDIDFVDKFVLHGGDIVQCLDGGSALHLNLDASLTSDQYYELICLASRVGCNYWTVNVRATCCEDCGHIDKKTLSDCPVCGSTNITYATRVIGYLKKVSSFSIDRQQEHGKRVYHK